MITNSLQVKLIINCEIFFLIQGFSSWCTKSVSQDDAFFPAQVITVNLTITLADEKQLKQVKYLLTKIK